MSGEVQSEVTTLLSAAARGEAGATDRLFPLVYEELRRMAGALMSREARGHTLQPTALVHEAYVRLVGPGGDGGAVSWENKAHFFGAAARAMRRILIDHARRVRAARSSAASGGEAGAELPTLGSGVTGGGVSGDRAADDLVLLDGALESLRTRDERQHEVVMYRFFGGLTIEQTAGVMGLSAATIKNEWSFARAWLLREMDGRRGGAVS
ncbi:MAG: RNA polymerase subunit sigma [Phycisphaeraceae bacterium]|nr:MAG: RNA polymerase subunit sigma [Phycisphaeraceae bacterium]